MTEERQKTKKKIYLATALLVALAISSGTFVYTYTATTITGDIHTVPEVVTVEESANQPDWASIVSLEEETVILRPYAKGDQTDIAYQYPETGQHWDKLNEEAFDGDGTYVYTTSASWQEDLYYIAGLSHQWGVIEYIRVYTVCRATAAPTQTSAYVKIKIDGTQYEGSYTTVTTSYAPYAHTWNTNPKTGNPWTWDEIGGLQIGIGLKRPGTAAVQDTRCSQLYVEVGYRHMVLSGDVPIGNVFDITLDAEYTGDVGVIVYLLNTGSLVKAYNYLSMKLELVDSVEGTYQLLTLANGVASFTLQGDSGATRTLSVTGGSYSLVSGDSAEWQPGWSVTPELHCEITQR